MNEDMIQKIRNQHLDSYRNTILDIISNNTTVLVEDISSLFEKPPLDSMDIILNKFLSEAKRNHIVLNADGLSQLLENYRESLKVCFPKIESLRANTLSSKVKHFTFLEDSDVFVFYKKDFTSIDRDMKKILKEQMERSFTDHLIHNISIIFQDSIEEEVKDKIIDVISKFMKKDYQKQIMDSFDIKVFVKDNTLMNSVKEQSDRYLFTIQNSRLLNPLE